MASLYSCISQLPRLRLYSRRICLEGILTGTLIDPAVLPSLPTTFGLSILELAANAPLGSRDEPDCLLTRPGPAYLPPPASPRSLRPRYA